MEADLESLLNELGNKSGVVSVEPVGVHTVDYYPDDQYFGLQWGLNQWRDHDVNGPEAWDVERGDSTIVIAVLDTGVDWMHPDLGGAAPYTGGNIYTNWVEFNGLPGVDDDGNGFIDDFRGWDFVNGVEGYVGEDVSVPDNDPSDFFGHGTHVAGIASALAGNQIGVASLANKCKIMPVRVGWAMPFGSPPYYTGVVQMDFCASGMYYAARNGARVINCSWGNDNSGGLSAAVDTAIARGCMIVVSAGNDATSSTSANYLGSRSDCFAVAAANSRDQRPSYSNYGAWIDFCAPGDTIASTFYNCCDARYPAHSYAYYNGTSMAAPFVSALCGLVLSKNHSLSRTEVQGIISSTCDRIDSLNPGYAGLLGAGRINAYAALSLGTGNWQSRAHGDVIGSPLPITGGSARYVAVTSADSCAELIRSSDGSAVAGWPQCGLGMPSSPAAGDIDGDSEQEIVVGTSNGNLYAWKISGNPASGWPVNLGSAVAAGPMICDLDKDGLLDVVCACQDSTLRVFSGNGSAKPGWPLKLSGFVTGDPCFAFVGPDTSSVVVVPTSDFKLRAFKSDGSSPAGWPVSVGSSFLRSPSAADVDGDGKSEVFVGGQDGKVSAIDDNGTSLSGWPLSATAAISGSVSLGDVDGDRVPEVVAASMDSLVYVWKLDGQALAGWPLKTEGPIFSSPSIVDLDFDGRGEVAVGSDDADLHVWTASGIPFAGWPRSTGGPVESSPCIWDFDADGMLEMAVGSNDTKLHFWELSNSPAVDSLLDWPMYRYDAQRRGNSGFQVQASAWPYILVTSPNGGERLVEGSSFNIRWIAYSPAGIDSISILYSLDGGSSFPYVIARGEANDSVYAWTVPGVLSDSARVRVVAYDRLLKSAHDDTDGFFSVRPRISPPALAVTSFPNPFSGTVTFELALGSSQPLGCCGERGRIRIYDSKGALVATLPVAGDGATLRVSWEGQNNASRKLASGVYYYRAELDGLKKRGKIVFLRR